MAQGAVCAALRCVTPGQTPGRLAAASNKGQASRNSSGDAANAVAAQEPSAATVTIACTATARPSLTAGPLGCAFPAVPP
jgi:hypothetical protein